MHRIHPLITSAGLLFALVTGPAGAEPAALPAVASHHVDFAREIKPLFESTCINCHGKGRTKGGFSLETRETFLKGGDSGPAVMVGNSAESLIVRLVAGIEPENRMPKKGKLWTAEQVGILRAWIDQGAAWDAQVTFAKPDPANLKPRKVDLPQGAEAHPVDRLMAFYFRGHRIEPSAVVDDQLFARRVYLDAIGLLPSVERLNSFVADTSPQKRTQLVKTLLADRRGYADHWLTFWNDLLRNDYRGTGFIDGGRKQISRWLYNALITNKRYDRFVAELLAPTSESDGFSHGIIWRGNVNASMLPPMQAAQNVAQVFMGVNLKCASCHDSFINDWTLADSYGLASIYSDDQLEMVHCDKPTGKYASMKFLYPRLGGVDATAPRAERLRQLESVVTCRENGRLSRTIVNRLWAKLLGRGLVEPLDDMEKPAWYADLLDWLAEDLVAHDYDLKRTMELILTSQAYQLPADADTAAKAEYVFRGPLTRRLTAEQFSDAISGLERQWQRMPATIEIDFSAGDLIGPVQMPQWVWTIEPVEVGTRRAHEQFDKKEAEAAAKRAEEEAKKKKEKEEEAAKASEPPDSKDAAAAERDPASASPSAKPAPGASDAAAKTDAASRDPEKPLAAKFELKPWERHRLGFRKTFVLDAVPSQAFAAMAASQGFGLSINGKSAGRVLSDGQRFGRVAVFDVRPLLAVGLNTIALDVTSHTEKPNLSEQELETQLFSRNHVNTISGVAFYLRAWMGAEQVIEVVSDESWRVRRAPEEGWQKSQFDSGEWLPVIKLPDGMSPVDEGPGLPPIRRKDFNNQPVDLGPTLRAAVTTAAQPGQIRASLLAADALMTALDRPNREQVITSRSAASTTLQALELTNGATLDERLKETAQLLMPEAAKDPTRWVEGLYLYALGRKPVDAERRAAQDLLGQPVSREGVADLIWAVLMLPEFQLIN